MDKGAMQSLFEIDVITKLLLPACHEGQALYNYVCDGRTISRLIP